MEQVKEEATNHGVWFANLGAYNQGRMLGAWVYPLQYDSYEKFAKRIKEVTRDTVDYADEIAVHDYDDFPNMGEFPCHKELYELIHAVNDSQLDNEVLFKYMKNNYCDYKYEYIDEAENSYITTCDNFNDYANEIADQDIECLVNKDAREFVYRNFDYESHSRDLEHSYTVIKLNNYDVAIFGE
jgi:antirestriction protein